MGARETPLLPDPDIADSCDLLILESTYGDGFHEDRKDRVRRLGEILERALSDKGKVFIPSFALGRTQELLYEMDRLFSDSDLKHTFPKLHQTRRIPVFLDSPLGLEVTNIYNRLSDFWDQEARQIQHSGNPPIDFDHLYAVENYKDHLKILDIPGPAIIIAGSGMCSGGRIVEHLEKRLEDSRNDIFFIGWQGKGTPGRNIIKYSRKLGGYVYLNESKVKIHAKVHCLTGYSAHADQKGLVDWVNSMPENPKKIKLVHGEPPAQRLLARVLRSQGYRVI